MMGANEPPDTKEQWTETSGYSSYDLDPFSCGGRGLAEGEVFEGIPSGWDILAFESCPDLILERVIRPATKEGEVDRVEHVAGSSLDRFESEEYLAPNHLKRGVFEFDLGTFAPGDRVHDAVVRSAIDFIRDFNERGRPWFSDR